jgi:hypothetical protein
MSKARLAALVGAILLAFAGSGHAAVVRLDGSLTLAPAGGASSSIGTRVGASGQTPSYYQLIVDPSWSDPAGLTALLAEPVAGGVSYALYVDTDASLAASDTGTLLARWSQGTPGSEFPFYDYLLGAGQFVLEVGTFASQPPASSRISALPLPGATWLFGSGLLAFLWISARHRL